MPSGSVTVIGPTGQQGGAVVESLTNQAVPVGAAARNPNGDKARTLARHGVEVVYADLEDERSMRAAFEGAAVAFAMTTHDGPDGPAREVAHGRVIAAAAAAGRLPFLLYSPVGGADRGSGVPHFESKHVIEELLRQAAMPLRGEVAVQLISVRDVGRVAAALLLRGDPGAAPVEIAGDELTGEQIAERISHASGSPAGYVPLPPDVLADDEDLKAMLAGWPKYPPVKPISPVPVGFVRDVEDLSCWPARMGGLR